MSAKQLIWSAGLKRLRELDTVGISVASSVKGDNFCDFLFVTARQARSKKKVHSKRKEFAFTGPVCNYEKRSLVKIVNF